MTINKMAADLWRQYLNEPDPQAAEMIYLQYLQALESIDNDEGEVSDANAELDETLARTG